MAGRRDDAGGDTMIARWLAGLAGSILALAAAAAPIEMTRDINRTVHFPDQFPRVAPAGNGWVLTLCSSSSCNPWFSDGTPAGTYVLKDFGASPNFSSNPREYTAMGGYTYFFAESLFETTSDYTIVTELWRTDGTRDGTVPLVELADRFQSGTVASGGLLYFINSTTSGPEMWRSDGTSAGTFKLASSYYAYPPWEPMVAGGIVYFVGRSPTSLPELWKTDGTVAGTARVTAFGSDPDGGAIQNLISAGNKVFFWANDGAGEKLWTSDGSAAGTVPILPATAGALRAPLVALNGRVAFVESDTLWVTDGTPAGTTSIVLGGSAALDPLVVAGNALYFVVNVVGAGGELWRSDGTSAGTAMVRDLWPGQIGSSVSDLQAVGSTLYFRANLPDIGYSLWRTDGTFVGTVMVQPNGDVYPRGALGDLALLWEWTGAWPRAWVSDGTSPGTRPLPIADGEPSHGSECQRDTPLPTVNVNGIGLFFANDGIHGCELWRSDGTVEGTRLLKDIWPGHRGAGYSYSASILHAAGGFAYFQVQQPGGQVQLWRSDGTETGTVALHTFSEIASVANFKVFGGEVYFTNYYDGQLWKTDGTQTGTRLVVQLPDSGNLGNLTVAGSALYFTDFGWSAHAGRLWRSDGTAAGTVPIAQFGASTGPLFVMGSNLYFMASDPAHGYELWRSDGTQAGTFVLDDMDPGTESGVFGVIGVVGNSVVFLGRHPLEGMSIWSTDGTPAGLTRLRELSHGLTKVQPFGPAAADGRLYFVLNDFHLLRTDGTAQGTVTVASHVQSDGLKSLVQGPGTLFFVVNDGFSGHELWMSSGTTGGTARVQDFTPGAGGMPLKNFKPAALNGGLFFYTTTGNTGAEPHFVAFDAHPDPTVFPPKTGVPIGSIATSDGVQVLGLNVPAAVTASGGQFCVSSNASCTCDFAPYATAGAVNFGQFLCVRHTAPAAASTTTVTTLTIAGVPTTFSSTTGATGFSLVEFDAPSFHVGEGGPVVSIPVQRRGSSDGAVSVRWTTVDGSAYAGTTFGTPGTHSPLSATLSWGAGDGTPKSITVGPGGMVPLIDNDARSPNAEFSIALSEVTGAAIGAASVATVVIDDNDANFGWEFQSTPVVNENGPNIEVWVIRDGSLAGSASIRWTASAASATLGSDFGASRGPAPSGILQFAPGEFKKAIVIGPLPGADIPIVNDMLIEPLEQFTITLSSPIGATLSGLAAAIINLVSDESGVSLAVSSLSIVEGHPFGGISIHRSGSVGAVTATYATVNGTAIAGTHYTARSGTLQWENGDTSPRFIGFSVYDDSAVGPARTFEFRLTGVAGSAMGSPSSAIITIVDNDNTVQFAAATAQVVEGAATLALPVTRIGSSYSSASVHWSTANGTALAGTDFGLATQTGGLSGVLNWAVGDNGSKTISIPVLNDAVPEGAKNFTVTLSSPSGATLGSMPTVAVTINDDDSGIMFDLPSYSVPEEGASVALKVNRVGQANSFASVTWSAVAGTATVGTDFGGGRGGALPTGTLNWVAGDVSPKTFSIPIVNDTIADGDKTFTVVLSAPSSGVTLSTPSTATVTIVDDEIAPETEISFSTTKVVVTEGAAGAASLVMTRTALPGHNCNRAVSVNYATIAGTALAFSDFTLSGGTFQWTAGDCSPKPLVGMPVVNDGVIEPPETFTIELANPSPGARLGVSQATVLVLDDDEAFPPPIFSLGGPWTKPAAANGAWAIEHGATPYEGSRTLRSETIGDSQSAQVEVKVDLAPAGGTLVFRVRVSSEEGFDFLRFYMDGVKLGEWSGTGNTAWQTISVPMTGGVRALRWSYEKDGSASFGHDAAWIDGVVLPPGAFYRD